MSAQPAQRARISVSMNEEIHKTGKALARAENRSFSNYLERLIQKDQEKQQSSQDS